MKRGASSSSSYSSYSAVRQRKVERARQLLRDPNYPPPEVIDSVSQILARKLKRSR